MSGGMPFIWRYHQNTINVVVTPARYVQLYDDIKDLNIKSLHT